MSTHPNRIALEALKALDLDEALAIISFWIASQLIDLSRDEGLDLLDRLTRDTLDLYLTMQQTLQQITTHKENIQ